MLKGFIAPIVVLVVVLTAMTVIGLNSEVLAQTSEVDQDYFLKPIPRANKENFIFGAPSGVNRLISASKSLAFKLFM